MSAFHVNLRRFSSTGKSTGYVIHEKLWTDLANSYIMHNMLGYQLYLQVLACINNTELQDFICDNIDNFS